MLILIYVRGDSQKGDFQKSLKNDPFMLKNSVTFPIIKLMLTPCLLPKKFPELIQEEKNTLPPFFHS